VEDEVRRILAVPIALLLTMSMVGNVLAVGATISPHSQTRNHGVASQWTLTWSGTGCV